MRCIPFHWHRFGTCGKSMRCISFQSEDSPRAWKSIQCIFFQCHRIFNCIIFHSRPAPTVANYALHCFSSEWFCITPAVWWAMAGNVAVEPDTTARRIREYLRENPGIAKGKYHAQRGSVEGHCYVASEAYFYASGGENSDLGIYCLSHDAGTHWYLRDDCWIDLTIERPEHGEGIPYGEGQKRAFITGYEPSQRAEIVNEALGLW